jgi:small-conductance mechanosensitive channel
MLFAIGLSNLVNFVFHVLFGDTAAKFIGWEQSPFQAEVGFASLGIGIAGVIAYKASLPF